MDVSDVEARFPGEIAGASLKLVQVLEGRPDVDPDSPAKSPGPH